MCGVLGTAFGLVAGRMAGVEGAVRQYLGAVVQVAGDVLGADLVGCYAAGSLALGGYQPGRSDIDVAVVCAGALTDGHKRTLVARWEALPCPARGVELVVYGRAVAASGTADPGFEVELNAGTGLPRRVTWSAALRPAADGLFWYGLDRSILHQSGLALWGPPAAEVFADLGDADLRRLLVESVHWWRDRVPAAGDVPAAGAEEMVLGACRALVKARCGVWLSKAGAGRRLAGAGFGTALIGRCLAARHGGAPPSGAQARAFSGEVLALLSAR